MSGAGHMLYAIKALKANRDLLKKRTLRNKTDFKRKTDGDKPVFKKTTPEQMRAVRAKIKRYKIKELRLNIFLLIISILIVFYLFWILIN
tara:strand:+ start:169069 stop:169338 length:270 start_codon:yes stop_codon:yes gene_type:complete